jgi:tryptophanyl-tRNA synthetase
MKRYFKSENRALIDFSAKVSQLEEFVNQHVTDNVEYPETYTDVKKDIKVRNIKNIEDLAYPEEKEHRDVFSACDFVNNLVLALKFEQRDKMLDNHSCVQEVINYLKGRHELHSFIPVKKGFIIVQLKK